MNGFKQFLLVGVLVAAPLSAATGVADVNSVEQAQAIFAIASHAKTPDSAEEKGKYAEVRQIIQGELYESFVRAGVEAGRWALYAGGWYAGVGCVFKVTRSLQDFASKPSLADTVAKHVADAFVEPAAPIAPTPMLGETEQPARALFDRLPSLSEAFTRMGKELIANHEDLQKDNRAIFVGVLASSALLAAVANSKTINNAIERLKTELTFMICGRTILKKIITQLGDQVPTEFEEQFKQVKEGKVSILQAASMLKAIYAICLKKGKGCRSKSEKSMFKAMKEPEMLKVIHAALLKKNAALLKA